MVDFIGFCYACHKSFIIAILGSSFEAGNSLLPLCQLSASYELALKEHLYLRDNSGAGTLRNRAHRSPYWASVASSITLITNLVYGHKPLFKKLANENAVEKTFTAWNRRSFLLFRLLLSRRRFFFQFFRQYRNLVSCLGCLLSFHQGRTRQPCYCTFQAIVSLFGRRFHFEWLPSTKSSSQSEIFYVPEHFFMAFS